MISRVQLSLLILGLLATVGCGGTPTATPDLVATEVAVRRAAIATLTAEAPTATKTPTHTATATATRTPTSTSSATATATRVPSPTPTSTAELSVTYQGCHYECETEPWECRYPPPYEESVRGYRSFQTLMVILNLTTDKTVEPPWKPDRWILTDGEREWEETRVWQWKPIGGDFYPQPPIGPGARATWTFVCFPVPRDAWVKAAEFTAWGYTYRFEFPNPYYGECTWYSCPY
jgi:hypothetical protein